MFAEEIRKTIRELEKATAIDAIYFRKSTGVGVFVKVIPEKSDYEVEDQFGFKVGGVASDFILRIDFDPDIGDTIRIGRTVYELFDFGSNGCWRWCDGYRYARRVHAREVA